jgi:hypothetical protein
MIRDLYSHIVYSLRSLRVRPLFRRWRLLVLFTALAPLCAGCGSYASQAEKNLTEARSEVAGAAFVLGSFGSGKISGPFTHSSLTEYAKAMHKSEQTLRDLDPPPGAEARHEEQLQALSRAHRLVQESTKREIQPGEAGQLARRLEDLRGELGYP